MSSESNGQQPDSQDPPGPSGPGGKRPSAQAPSAWGAARDALASVHNLEALLRSATVDYQTILDLLPELRSSAGVLREAFERARDGDEAISAVGRDGGARVSDLVALLDETAAGRQDRAQLASRARLLADQLEASADLLALVERASAPAPTEVSLNLIVRETFRTSSSGRGSELHVRLDEASPDCVVTTDPYVVGPLLALAVAHVHARATGEVAVRARSSPPHATLLVEAATTADSALSVMALRVLPAVPPASQAAVRIAEKIGALLVIEPARWAIALEVASGG